MTNDRSWVTVSRARLKAAISSGISGELGRTSSNLST